MSVSKFRSSYLVLAVSKKNEVADIAAELFANTALQWETVLDTVEEDLDGLTAVFNPKKRVADRSASEATNRKIRQGRVHIPSKCLYEIIVKHLSFASCIYKPPVKVKVSIGRSEGKKVYVESRKQRGLCRTSMVGSP